MASNKVDRKLPKENMVKVGRLKYTVAKEIGCISADIYYSKTNTHLEKHSKEINAVGLTIYKYIEFIVDNFNQIREGKDDSLMLLVINNDKKSNIACIKLTLRTDNNYEIITIQPRRLSTIKNFKVLWEKK